MQSRKIYRKKKLNSTLKTSATWLHCRGTLDGASQTSKFQLLASQLQTSNFQSSNFLRWPWMKQISQPLIETYQIKVPPEQETGVNQTLYYSFFLHVYDSYP